MRFPLICGSLVANLHLNPLEIGRRACQKSREKKCERGWGAGVNGLEGKGANATRHCTTPFPSDFRFAKIRDRGRRPRQAVALAVPALAI